MYSIQDKDDKSAGTEGTRCTKDSLFTTVCMAGSRHLLRANSSLCPLLTTADVMQLKKLTSVSTFPEFMGSSLIPKLWPCRKHSICASSELPASTLCRGQRRRGGGPVGDWGCDSPIGAEQRQSEGAGLEPSRPFFGLFLFACPSPSPLAYCVSWLQLSPSHLVSLRFANQPL